MRSDVYGVPTHFNEANYIGRDPLADWQGDDVPVAIKRPIEYLQHDVDFDQGVSGFNQLIADFAGSFPIVGGLLKGIANMTGVNFSNRNLVKSQNRLQQAYARFQNWYNSPVQQVKRLRASGLNPFMQSYVKNYPAADAHFEHYVPVSGGSSTFAADLNAITNANLAEYKAENLESLTDLNNYKLNYLLPQLFTRNGYINSIMDLQVAWEQDNYNLERQLKQNILGIQNQYSLLHLAQLCMELQPVDGSYHVVCNPDDGTIGYVDNAGNSVNLSDKNLSDWPLFMQQAYKDLYLKQSQITSNYAGASLSRSNVNLNTSRFDLNEALSQQALANANTQGALASLYTFNFEKASWEFETYKKTGVWPSEDFVLRLSAGMVPDNPKWYQLGTFGHYLLNSSVSSFYGARGYSSPGVSSIFRLIK